MRNICFILSCCGFALSAAAQTIAPVAVPLGAYAQPLQAPARIATDAAGTIYVTDPQAGQVVVLDAIGRAVATRAGFASPLGIAVDAGGRIYLGEEQTGSVSVFDAGWNLLYKLGGGDGEFQLPNHIALDRSNTVFVSDSKANAIKVYAGATLVNQFGTAGTANGQFDFPAGICLRTNGEIMVVDQNNDRAQVFDPNGAFLRRYRFAGMLGPSGRKQGAVLDNAGRFYVADAFQGTVRVLDEATGSSLATVGNFGAMIGQLSTPGGVAVDACNRLLVASPNNGRVELFGLDAFVHLSMEPAANTVPAGTNLIFTVVAGGAGPLAYQWSRNAVNITGATHAMLTIPSVAAGDAGGYSVAVTGPSGTITSLVVQVAVMAPPAILTAPQSQTVVVGANVEMSVDATGESLTFQWHANGLPLEGATNRTLALPDVQTFQAGVYTVIVHNAVGTVVSAPAVLTVLASPSVVEIVSCSLDADRLFHLTLNATPGFTYTIEASTDLSQWQSLTNIVNDTGLFDFTDPDPSVLGSRFYRVRWGP